MLEERIIKSIDKYKEEAFTLNEYLFAHPELSGQEYGSCKKIREVLGKYGIETEDKFMGIETAFFGHVIEKDSNINLAILIEYDALPDVGHACGHSASAGISLLATLALKDNEDLIDANIDIIGTPDEEDAGMKIPMADNGVFDKYDCAIMVHLDTKNVPNWKMLAFETYEIEFTGKAAHTAASPWEGRSALDGLMLSIHAFDMIRKCAKPETIIEGFIREGGIATNIVPEKAVGKYTFRSNSAKYVREVLTPWAMQAIDGCAMATQTKAEVKPFGYPFSDMNYLESGTDEIEQLMKDYGMEPSIMEKAVGSSDMGNVSYRCPSFHPSVQITSENFALHSVEFAEVVGSEKAKQCIINGATIIGGFYARLLEKPELLKVIKEEFEASRG